MLRRGMQTAAPFVTRRSSTGMWEAWVSTYRWQLFIGYVQSFGQIYKHDYVT